MNDTDPMTLDRETDEHGTHGWLRADPWSLFVSVNSETGRLTVEVYPTEWTDQSDPLRTITVDPPYEPDGVIAIPGFGSSQY